MDRTKLPEPNLRRTYKPDIIYNRPETTVELFYGGENSSHDVLINFFYDDFHCLVGYHTNMDMEILSFSTLNTSNPITPNSEAQRTSVITLMTPTVKKLAQQVINEVEIDKSNIKL